MQDPTAFQSMKPHFPEMEQLKCPRCNSTNTKFCYYNNYNLSQPRHFCKNCRRYWTKGGALRNIPVGGGTRKNSTKKRQKPDPDPDPARSNNGATRKGQESSRSGATAAATATSQGVGIGSDTDPRRLYGLGVDPDHNMLDITGSFSSLLASSGGLGSVLDGMNPNGSGMQMGGFVGNFGSGQNLDSFPSGGSGTENQGNNNNNNNGDSICWSGGSNGWPDIAIYTPSSNFQ